MITFAYFYATGHCQRNAGNYFKDFLTFVFLSRDLQEQELQWLRQEPGRLLTHYQFIVEATVTQFIARGFFAGEEKSELVQEINIQLLEKKLERIREQYNGSVYLRTYFSKVVYNSCLEIARRQKRQPRFLTEETLHETPGSGLDAYEQMAIRDELYRLEGFLRGLGARRMKSELCLKLFARLILKYLDIKAYDTAATKPAVEKIKSIFFQAYDHFTDKEVYEQIVGLFNAFENKLTDGDSLRKWVSQLADRLIELLNGHPPVGAYSREVLAILLRLYYEQPLSVKN